MSDLCTYGLEDSIWDDVCRCNDHIAPRPRVGSCVASDTGGPFAVELISQEQGISMPFGMLEKEGWSQKSDGVLSQSSESIKEESSLTSGGARTTPHCNDSSLSDEIAAGGSSFDCPLDQISELDNNLCFFSNNLKDKDSNNLLYYDWQDVGNLEDVDQMFRSCDSTFELCPRNEDEYCWFSSLDAIGGSEDAFSCLDSSSLKSISESHDASRLNEIDDQNKQLKHQNRSAGGRNDQYLEDGSFLYVDDMAGSVRQQKQVAGTGAYKYLPSDAHPTPSAVKLENRSLTSLSTKDSCISNQMQSEGCRDDPSFPGTSIASMEKREKHSRATSNDNPENVDLAVQASASGRNSMKNLVYFSGDKLKNNTDIGGNDMGYQVEVDSSFAAGISSKISRMEDISKEATSFHQLQLVMEQLDLRTKLCIRDSLYRLARSAEQRHFYAPLTSGYGDNRDANDLFAEGTNKYIDFPDMETETNPIDRSMAHLLYHRPTGSSAMPGHDIVSFSSPMPASF